MEVKKEPPKSPASVTPDKIQKDQVVFLERALKPLSFAPGISYSLLKRELLREALLLSAREEFGLRTRDDAAKRLLRRIDSLPHRS